MNKKAVGWPYIVGLIIGLIVIGVMAYIAFRSRGSMLDYLKHITDMI